MQRRVLLAYPPLSSSTHLALPAVCFSRSCSSSCSLVRRRSFGDEAQVSGVGRGCGLSELMYVCLLGVEGRLGRLAEADLKWLRALSGENGAFTAVLGWMGDCETL